MFRPLISTEPWSAFMIQVRHNKPNLQRPLPLHYKKARMLAVVKPKYPPELRVCDKLRVRMNDSRNIENNDYALFLAREMRTRFHSYPMLALFHANSYKELEFMKVRGMLFDAKFDMKIESKLNKEVCRHALMGTRFEPALPLVASRSAVGYCSEENVPKLLKVVKKMPQFVLIGLIFQNRLMHRADIEAYAKLPNLITLQSTICNTLTLASSNVHGSLQANQIELSRNLLLHSSNN